MKTKTITVKNPSNSLLAIMTNPIVKYIKTCHSDTCNHVSHDAGYDEFTGEVPHFVEVEEVGGSVHSHPTTIRIDTPVGSLESRQRGLLRSLEQASPGSYWSTSGARREAELTREYRVVTDALVLLKSGICETVASALYKAEGEMREQERVAKAEKRLVYLAEMVGRGLTNKEALASYGAGKWSNEQDWAEVKARLVQLGWNDAHLALSGGATATTTREMRDAVETIFSGSFPRVQAWVKYALEIFYDGEILPHRREKHGIFPVAGKNWQLVN